jgi:hypothetical protein
MATVAGRVAAAGRGGRRRGARDRERWGRVCASATARRDGDCVRARCVKCRAAPRRQVLLTRAGEPSRGSCGPHHLVPAPNSWAVARHCLVRRCLPPAACAVDSMVVAAKRGSGWVDGWSRGVALSLKNLLFSGRKIGVFWWTCLSSSSILGSTSLWESTQLMLIRFGHWPYLPRSVDNKFGHFDFDDGVIILHISRENWAASKFLSQGSPISC